MKVEFSIPLKKSGFEFLKTGLYIISNGLSESSVDKFKNMSLGTSNTLFMHLICI